MFWLIKRIVIIFDYFQILLMIEIEVEMDSDVFVVEVVNNIVSYIFQLIVNMVIVIEFGGLSKGFIILYRKILFNRQSRLWNLKILKRQIYSFKVILYWN